MNFRACQNIYLIGLIYEAQLSLERIGALAGKATILALLLLFTGVAEATSVHPCSADAVEHAKKLLEFHFGGPDDRMTADASATTLSRMKNPENPKKFFDVLEIWGHIYKGRYRMRFIYYKSVGGCLLMGQEILEYANP